MPSGLKIVSTAFFRIGVKPPDQDLQAAPAAAGLDELNLLIGTLNAQGVMIPCRLALAVDLTANQRSYTIGPTGDVETARPTRIEPDGNTILIDTIAYPVGIGTFDQYKALTIPSLTGPWPFSAYYQGTLPDATVHVWPVPSTPYTMTLIVKSQLDAFETLEDGFDMAQGFENMLIWNLAEALLAAYPNPAASPYVLAKARETRAAVSTAAPVDMSVTTDAPRRRGGLGGREDFYSGGYVR